MMPTSTPSPSSASPLARIMDLEAHYDGPIPAHERRAIAFDSELAADIAEISAETAFFRAMVERTRSSGKAWLLIGNRELAAHARADARVYLSAWRNRRSRLAKLLHDAGCARRGYPGARQTLAAITMHIVTPLVEGNSEDRQ